MKLYSNGNTIGDVYSSKSSLIKIKVAQWNLGHFGMGAADTNISAVNSDSKALEYRRLLNTVGADIVCCSEYNPAFDIAGNLATQKVFPNYRDNNIGVKNVYHCNAIFNNAFLDIVEKKTINYTNTSQYFIVTRVKVMGEEVYIVATHLAFDPDPNVESGENKAQFEQLAQYFANKDYVILCGDFNAKKDTYWQKLKDVGFSMANHGVIGAFKTEPDSCITHTTGNVDNICVKGFSINNIWYEECGATETQYKLSDHGIVSSDLVMQKGT